MIHPDTKLQLINEEIGLGIKATDNIPKGTIMYIEDALEQVITSQEYEQLNEMLKSKVEIYSYRDQNGNRIVSWDHAKYVNHSCSCNTISTGYGFEITIKDIKKGEQVTDDYGLFNMETEMACCCGSPNCRQFVRPDDIDRYYKEWDEKIKKVLVMMDSVKQPLMPLIDGETKKKLDRYFSDPENYVSVYSLKYEN